MENGANGAISRFLVMYNYMHVVQNFSSILVMVSCLYEHLVKSYKQKREQYLYRLLLRKRHFSLNAVFPFTLNWPHPLLFQNGVFLVASREKVS